MKNNYTFSAKAVKEVEYLSKIEHKLTFIFKILSKMLSAINITLTDYYVL